MSGAGTGRRWPLSVAKRTADAFAEDLRPACLRITVAGSIRRRRPEVGDIEIVAIPKIEPLPVSAAEDLFASVAPIKVECNLLWNGLDGYLKRDGRGYIRKGDLYRSFQIPLLDHYELIQVDLFTCDVHNWGSQLMTRTGPWEFSKWMLGSALRSRSLRSVDARIYHTLGPDKDDIVGPPISTPEEADVFRLAGVTYIPPEERGLP